VSKKVLRQHRLNLAFLLTMSVFAPCGASLLAQSNAPLTEKDTIVLADFDNQSGETVFDGALEQALTIALGQSPFLNVLSDRKVSESLRAMQETTGLWQVNAALREVDVRGRIVRRRNYSGARPTCGEMPVLVY
jgi:hypothetical protein